MYSSTGQGSQAIVHRDDGHGRSSHYGLPHEFTAVRKTTPCYLKLHNESKPAPAPTISSLPSVEKLCEHFTSALGWQLEYQVGVDEKASPLWQQGITADGSDTNGRLVIRGMQQSRAANDRESLAAVEQLAGSIAEVLSELHRTRRALWKREAELAASVPVTPRQDEREHLAETLQAVLRAGAEAVECQAAAAYLLDDATSHLKLRAAWGEIPWERLLEVGRPLQGSAADLEALVGHAVVIEDTAMLKHWRLPEEEQFASAICVPIASPSAPLGTLWMFSREPRGFDAVASNVVEITAGRVAAELDRWVLLNEGMRSKRMERELTDAVGWQLSRLPTISPAIDGWQVAGWTSPAVGLNREFHDWSVVPDGTLSLTVGAAHGSLVEAGLTAAMLHTAVKDHGCYRHRPLDMVDRVNQTFWTSSAGDQFADLFYGMLEPESGELEFAVAGRMVAFLLDVNGARRVTHDSLPLGTQPESTYCSQGHNVPPGTALIIFSEGAMKTLEAKSQVLNNGLLMQWLGGCLSAPVEVLLERLVENVRGSEAEAVEQTVLIAQHMTP